MNFSKQTKYSIKRGDTLYRLAHVFRTTEEEIIVLNPGLDPMYLQVGRIIIICPNTTKHNRTVYHSNQNNCISEKQSKLHDRFRELWEQHIIYTDLVINAVVDSGSDENAVTARLLQNPGDFAKVYREIYGEVAANEIERLITEHLTEGKGLITAMKTGDIANTDILNTEWYQNADKWAAYLAKLSPNLNESAMRDMLHTHLDLIKEQVAARIAKNYNETVIVFDKSQGMALEMADMMSRTIIVQFPEHFKK